MAQEYLCMEIVHLRAASEQQEQQHLLHVGVRACQEKHCHALFNFPILNSRFLLRAPL